MRAPNQLVHSRARARQRYALFPLEGFPTSRLPSWENAEAFVLAAPALGANFVQYLANVQESGGCAYRADGRTETFLFILSGGGRLELDDGNLSSLTAGSFALIPPTRGFDLSIDEPTSLLALRKVYEPSSGIEMYESLVGNAANTTASAWMNNEHSRLQTLIPDDLRYDLAMNIFTFESGHGLPYVETHVMEHGLLMLEGKGMYYLDGEWMEVEKDDFLWMGSYCPQSFYATGPTPAKYIYYKNVNREIAL
ncbi:MAG: (S)-ureidoglycine aminohydrolase [Tepidisphaeraceae bacterium]